MIQMKKPPWYSLSGDSCCLSAEVGHSAWCFVEFPLSGSIPGTLDPARQFVCKNRKRQVGKYS